MPDLKNEANKIYYAIFEKDIPISIQEHFENLSKTIKSLFSEQEIKKYHKCVLEINDLEALELAARYFKKLPILTLKFKIMVYLGETSPENYHRYVNEKDDYFRGHILLITAVIRTFYKFVKGVFLLISYRP